MYVTNTGECGTPENSDEIYQKAESLSQFSYHERVNELMLLDLQECCYQLYDPEIVTGTLTDGNDNDSKETFSVLEILQHMQLIIFVQKFL